MIEGYLDETLEAIHIALKDASLTASDIDKILLVGGSTRTPAVRRRLHDEFGVEAHSEVHPDLCVATGAAIQAAMIGGDKVTTVLVDVTPYTYGTDAFGELDGELTPFMYVPIIRKNSPLPVSKSEVFYTMHDGQIMVDVKIYQGEDPNSLNNILIGQFRVEGLQDVPSGNPIVVSLDLDLNGILHVSAREKETGLEKHITIENAISRFEAQQLDQARERIAAIFGETLADQATSEMDSATQEHHEIVKARALVEKAERMLEQASAEDREDMVNLLETLREAIAAEDFSALGEAMESLSDILYYLES
jgi:molecular chaperone DnaK (HSP70)